MNQFRAIAGHSIRAILHGRRLVAAGFLALVPMLLAAVVLLVRARVGSTTLSPGAVYRFLVPGYFHALVILVAVLFATSVISEDEEDGSVVYLVVRPLRRGAIYLGKTAAAIAATAALVLIALVPTFAIFALGGGTLPISLLLKDVSWLALASLAYPAAFAALSAASKRPILIAAVYLFLWEIPLAFAPTSLRYLTVSHYVLSLMPHSSVWNAAVATLGLGTAVPAACLGLLALATAWIALGSVRYERREHLATGGG